MIVNGKKMDARSRHLQSLWIGSTFATRKQQEELKAIEVQNAKKEALRKQKWVTEKARREKDPSIVARSSAKRLKGSEKKAAEAKKREQVEKEQKAALNALKKIRQREKQKLDVDQVLVYYLRNTTTMNYFFQVESAIAAILLRCDYQRKEEVRYLIDEGVFEALFGCLLRFPNDEWLSMKSLQVVEGLLQTMFTTDDGFSHWMNGGPEGIPTVRTAFVQLCDAKACDFVVQIIEKYCDDFVVIQKCIEVLHQLTRNVTHKYRYDGSYYTTFDNPNIKQVCRHPRIESLVVQLFNQHHQTTEKRTKNFVRYSVQLMLTIASNDVSAAYRPEMCEAVVTAMDKYAGNDGITTIGKQAIVVLSKNVQNKDKLHGHDN